MTSSRSRELAKGIVSYVNVGIMKESSIEVSFCGMFSVDSDGEFPKRIINKTLVICYSQLKEGREYIFKAPKTKHFSIKNVEIGINFHWNEKKTFSYKGDLVLKREGDKILVVNRVNIEDYIYSVISSEMASTCPLELLKAHAIISRSWLVSQLQRKEFEHHPVYVRTKQKENADEMIEIWDAMGHTDFDVCSDDHCQRYQGFNDEEDCENVKRAIKETKGIILKSEGKVCDTRFSKCCGGISELFSTCWSDEDYAYLSPVRCNIERKSDIPNLREDIKTKEWILNSPTDTYCSAKDGSILSRILKAYDKKTISDFYRWTISYEANELSSLIKRKIGLDLGKIISLNPIEVGASGRIKRLQIIGTRGSKVIGKELLIRKALSETHLLSSAFVVEKRFEGDKELFVFRGAGWGHGVGMCQIGAAVMAEKGYSYKDILSLYYPTSMFVSMQNK